MKTFKLSLLSLALMSVLFSCKTNKKEVEVEKATTHKVTTEHHKKAHWTYTGETGPENWSNISEKYKACAGKQQSPINIETKNVVKPAKQNALKVDFGKSKTDIINNGHTIQFNIDKGNYVTFNGKKYELKQFHMHSLSEHTIDGKHLPLEIHFVSKADDGTYAVIGVFYKEGKESPFFTKFLSKLPTKENEQYKTEDTFDINMVLPNTDKFYHYNGSFTTPPCTEIVEWIVLKDFKEASKEQLETLHHLLHDNFRPVQELNGRKVALQ